MLRVSFLDLAPRAHLRCLSRKSSFVDVSGLVSEAGSEGSFEMPVEKIEPGMNDFSGFEFLDSYAN